MRVRHALACNDQALVAAQRVLALNPQLAQAHNLAGDVLLELGQTRPAIASYLRALEIEPLYFVALTSLGDAQRQLGQFDAALQSYGRAAAIHPDVAQLHMKLANTLVESGQLDAALQAMLRALALDPESATVQFNAGNLYDAMGNPRAAATHYQRSLAIAPDAKAFNNLGNVQKKLDQPAQAIASYRQALLLAPDYAQAHSNLGLALQDAGQYEQALASLQSALQFDPGRAFIHNNIAMVLLDLNLLAQAETSCRRALEIDASLVEAHCNLGAIQLALGQLDAACDSFNQALQLAPNYSKALYNLSHAQLSRGQLAQGWQNYEHRWHEQKTISPTPHLPQWLGQQVASGDRLMVYVEQGLGDMLQMSRYLPMLAERFPAGVSLYTLRPLASFFRRSFPQIEVMDTLPANPDAWQWQCPLLSLPLAFGTVLDTIPAQVPYLIPDSARCAYWQNRISQLGLAPAQRKIGIVWKPGMGMKIAHLKATSLQALAPLLEQPLCTWFSLQKEPDPQRAKWVDAGRLIDWSGDFTDFDETAALAMNLDLVISVDTSVAHLAGGLGLPTWLLNRYASDWRWMRGREDSPWYPTVRIFAQQAPGDWDAVAQRMATELAVWHP